MAINRPILLASSSPRRQFLLKEIGINFTIRKPDVAEDFSSDMPVNEVAMFLANKKAMHFQDAITNEIVVAADTVVIIGNQILNKPVDRQDAIDMLSLLSANTHTVRTGVCMLSKEKLELFDDATEVTFKKLSLAEINFYVDTYSPYDKAGAYGAQDWIGMVAIEKIVGSYFNVMGLPIHKVYEKLIHWD